MSTKSINVVAGLIFRERLVLACQRHEKSAFSLKWEFPGGKVEEGETNFEALRRELREELDIEVHSATEILHYTHTYPEFSEVNLRFFRVDDFNREVRNLVFQQIDWVDIRELGRLDFLDGDLPLIRKLMRQKGAHFQF